MTRDPRPLAGSWTLATGASSGIGWELARCLAAAGSNLVLVARDRALLEEAAATLVRERGVRVEALPPDLADPSAPAALAQEIASRRISVDVLVNNAGFGLSGRFLDTALADERRMLRVNVDALLELTKHFLPGMVSRRRGRILNLSSSAGFFPGPFMAVYYASKAFVLSFSEALASELAGTGVTVTCLCPGPTRTQFSHRAGNEGSRLFRSGLTMNAEAVAQAGVRGLLAGKSIVIPGYWNRLLVESARISPRALVTRISRYLNES